MHSDVRPDGAPTEGETAGAANGADYTERLRRLALHDPGLVEELLGSRSAPSELDARTMSLVRLAALVAVGGSVPSYGAHADAAVDAGASVAEIVAVLDGLVPVVGLPRVVAAAPSLAMALGYEADDVFAP